MSGKPELGSCRFAVTKTDEGSPVLKLELFHDTVPSLRSLSIAFEVLSGTTLEQARTPADATNERVIGVIITAK